MNRVSSDRGMAKTKFQSLENRRLLAAFETPWPDQRDLAISFPSDGVQVGNDQNEVNELLDGIAQRQSWQELALRAYQTWSIHADINVGLRSDYNHDFGTPGRVVGDPRFGEFRIGAIPQEGLIANSVPFQAVAGTYSGDILLNSNQQFTFHDWDNDLGPEPASIGPEDRDLFSLLLHESGNTLGVDDNLMDWTVMFRQYTAPKGILAEEDIASIQAIYGERSDPYEQVDNGQVQSASVIPIPIDLNPATEVIRSRGSLVDGSDVDHYKITPPANRHSVTVRLHATGVSLLKSRLEIVTSSGFVIRQADAQSVFENNNELTIYGIHYYPDLYVRVSALDPDDVYAVGDYWLEFDYRTAASRNSDPTPGGYDSGPESLYTNFSLIDGESDAYDTIAEAIVMNDRWANESDRYEIESSVSSQSDVDYLKVTAPEQIFGRLIVHVAGVGLESPDLRLQVVDATGQPIGTAARLHKDGTFSIEVAQPQAAQDYFIRVSVDPNSAVGVGNYVAVAEFEAPHAQLNPMSSGALSETEDRFIRWTAEKSKLFRFDLSASGAHSQQAVRLTIYDAHTREVKLVAVSQAGVTRSALGWLQQGEYIVRFSAISIGNASVSEIGYELTTDGISDDQDDDSDDPADTPGYDPYYYEPYDYDPYQYEYSYDPNQGYGYDYEYGYGYVYADGSGGYGP